MINVLKIATKCWSHQEKYYNSLCYKKIPKTLRYICITTEAQIVIG